jgi:hypothetical protein
MTKKTWIVILATAGAVIEAIKRAITGRKA